MRIHSLIAAALALPCGALAAASPPAGSQLSQQPSAPGRPVSTRRTQLPLSFEANRGQFDSRVRFASRSAGATVFLTNSGAVIALAGKPLGRPVDGPSLRRPAGRTAGAALRMTMAGARRTAPIAGEQRLPGVVNYLRGRDPKRWRTGVPTYRQVRYAGVYPGTDLVYYGNPHRLEYDFVLRPGADPSHIRMAFSGARRLHLAANGDLIAATTAGEIALKRPYAYQTIAGRRVQVACTYTLAPGSPTVALRLARYDTGRTLVVDPSVAYSTLLGGSSDDLVYGEAVGAGGALFAVGATVSTDYPTTEGAYSRTRTGFMGIVVTKLNAAGSGLVYSTYIGGNEWSYALACAAAPDGSLVVAGSTSSTTFPTTTGAFRTVNSGAEDAFVLKLNSSGSALVYSTLLGGASTDNASGVALDSAGRPVVCGSTNSVDFPVSGGARQTSLAGDQDGWTARLSVDGTSLEWGTYHGGTAFDECNGITLDASNNVYLAGSTVSSDFPTTGGAFDTSKSSSMAAYISKLDATGTSLTYSTLVESSGATDETKALSLCLGSGGAVVFAGQTNGNAFPATSGAFNEFHTGTSFDAVVGILSADGASLTAATYLGGSSFETAAGVCRDAGGGVWIAGYTRSDDLGATADAYQSSLGGAQDMFVSRLTPTLNDVTYQTYVGGADDEYATCIAGDPARGAIFVGGYSLSTDFPTTVGAYQVASAGMAEGALLRFDAGVTTTLTADAKTGAAGTSVTLSATLLDGTTPVVGKSVDFTVDGVSAGSGTTNASGIATHTYAIAWGATVGGHPIAATWAGDVGYAPSSGAATLTVTPPATVLAVADVTGEAGEAVTLTATLTSNGSPVSGKTISFTVDGIAAGSATTNGSGIATRSYTIAAGAALGAHTIGATFAGDSGHAGSSGSGTLTVDLTGTTLAVGAATGQVGGTASLTATLTEGANPVAGLSVSFTVGGVAAGSATTNASGVATYTYSIPSSATPGTPAIGASFAGNTTYAASSGSNTLTITKETTVLVAADRTAPIGRTISLSATLTGHGAGRSGKTVAFTVDGVSAGSASTNGSGVASVSYNVTAGLTIGAHTIGVEFAGDGSSLASSGSGTLSVLAPAHATWIYVGPQTGAIGSKTTLTAEIYDATLPHSKVNGRTVNFQIDGVLVGSAVTQPGPGEGMQASLEITITDALTPGAHTITGLFDGDNLYEPNSGTNTLTVTKTAARLTGADVSAAKSARVALKGVLSRPGGYLVGKTLTFKVDGTTVGTGATNAGGIATVIYTATVAAGEHALTVEYAGDATTTSASATNRLTVTAAATNLFVPALSKSYYDQTLIGAQLFDTLAIAKLAGKTVSFKVDGVDIGSATTQSGGNLGMATVAYTIPTSLTVGSHTITATFAGDADYATSSQTATLSVDKATTRIDGTSPTVATGAVTLLSGVLSRNGGYGAGKTLTFKVDGSVVGSGATGAGGKATLLYTAALAAGSHTIRVEFAGDSILKASFVETTLTVTP